MGDNVQHGLELFNIGKGLAAGKHKIAPGRDGVHPADAFHDLLQREASHITVFFLVDAERAVILTIVRNEDCDGRAALSGFVRMFHDIDRPFHSKESERLSII